MKDARPAGPPNAIINVAKKRVAARLFAQRDVPASIGRYRLVGAIGRGGMGLVYRAYDPQTGRAVAIKLLHRPLPGASDGFESLLSEARAIARIRHPHVVEIYDWGWLENDAYIVMELVVGISLGEWLSTEKPSVDRRVQTFVEAGRALAAIHEGGLVHGDWKPDNLVRTNDGGLKVLDFGLARVLDVDTEALDAANSQPNLFAGTPRYMAPELLFGARPDPRSDQFAFAVSMYEALWGRHPFAAERSLTLDGSQDAYAPRPPPLGRRTFWPVLQRALLRDPDRRWPSMRALCDALELRRARVRANRGRLRRAAIATSVTLAATFATVVMQRAEQADARVDAPTIDRHDGPRAPEPSTDAQRAELARLQEQVHMLTAVRDPSAVALAQRSIEVANALADPLLRSEAHHALGRVLLRLQRPDDAREPFMNAYLIAQSERLDANAAEAAISLMDVDWIAGRFDEALRWARHAETLLQAGDAKPELRAKLELHRGRVFLSLGRTKAARAAWTELLGKWREGYTVAPVDVLELLLYLGELEMTEGQPEAARPYFEEGLALAHHQVEAVELRALLERGLGQVEMMSDRDRAALVHFERARAAYIEKFGPDAYDAAIIDINIGNVLFELGDLTEAERVFRRAVTAMERNPEGTAPNLAMVLGMLATVLATQGDATEATAIATQGLNVARSSVSLESEHGAQATLFAAQAYYLAGEPKAALDYYGQLLFTLRPGETVSDHLYTITAEEHGHRLFQQGRWGESEIMLRLALVRTQTRNELGIGSPLIHRVRVRLARTLLARGELDEAATLIREFEAECTTSRCLPEDWIAHDIAAAELAVARGRLRSAGDLFGRALERTSAGSSWRPEFEVESRLGLARVAVARGDRKAARRWLRRVRDDTRAMQAIGAYATRVEAELDELAASLDSSR